MIAGETDALRGDLDRLVARCPPYIARYLDRYLASWSLPDQAKIVNEVCDVIARHLAVLCVSAMAGRDRNGHAPPLDVGMLNDPLGFLRRTFKGSCGATLFPGIGDALGSGESGALPRLVALRNGIDHGRPAEQLAPVLLDVVRLAERALALPVFLQQGIHRMCREYSWCQCLVFQGPGAPRPVKFRLSSGEPELFEDHCFVRIPDAAGPTGWLVDLFPWVALVTPKGGGTSGVSEVPTIGLRAAPPKGQTTELYDTGSLAREFVVRGEGQSGGVVLVGDGWFGKREQIPPSLRDEGERAGFEFDEVVGEGSFGSVYKARHRDYPERAFALKVLHPGSRARRGELRRTLREVERMSSSLGSGVVLYSKFPGAIRLDPDGPEPHWFTMDFVEGPVLTSWAARSHAEQERRRVALAIVQAAACLHARGITHRDIRPENVMMREGPGGECSPVLVDLGLARIVPLEELTRHSSTVGGFGFGRAPFAPPEQLNPSDLDRARDPRVDVHALAWTLHWVLRGGKLSDRIDDEPHPWNDLLARCVGEDPRRRPRDACELLEELMRSEAVGDFGPGLTLADGSHALGYAFEGRDDLLAVVPPAPYSDLRGLSSRIETPLAPDWEKIPAAWERLSSLGAPISPLLGWAVRATRERQTATLTVVWPFASDSEPLASARLSVADWCRVVHDVLVLARAMAHGHAGVHVRMNDLLVSRRPAGGVAVVALRPGRRLETDAPLADAAIDSVKAGLRDGGMEWTSPGSPTFSEGGGANYGWKETRDASALLEAGLQTIREVGRAFDGEPVDWKNDYDACQEGLRLISATIIEDGWATRVDEFGPEEERRREEFDREKSARKAAHERAQEARRRTHEEEQERKRAIHEENEDARIAAREGEDLPRRPYEGDLFKPAEFEDHELVRGNPLPSKIVFLAPRRPTAYETTQARPLKPVPGLGRRVKSALASFQTEPFWLRDALALADSAAWFIGLVGTNPGKGDPGDSPDASLWGIAGSTPSWRPRVQVGAVLSMSDRSGFFEDEELRRLASCVNEVERTLDLNGILRHGRSGAPAQIIGDYLSLVADLLAEVEVEEHRYRRVTSGKGAPAPEVRRDALRCPLDGVWVRPDPTGIRWLHGVYVEEPFRDAAVLVGRFGCPPEVPLERWRLGGRGAT